MALLYLKKWRSKRKRFLRALLQPLRQSLAHLLLPRLAGSSGTVYTKGSPLLSLEDFALQATTLPLVHHNIKCWGTGVEEWLSTLPCSIAMFSEHHLPATHLRATKARLRKIGWGGVWGAASCSFRGRRSSSLGFVASAPARCLPASVLDPRSTMATGSKGHLARAHSRLPKRLRSRRARKLLAAILATSGASTGALCWKSVRASWPLALLHTGSHRHFSSKATSASSSRLTLSVKERQSIAQALRPSNLPKVTCCTTAEHGNCSTASAGSRHLRWAGPSESSNFCATSHRGAASGTRALLNSGSRAFSFC